jgi:hypothetical protein
MGLFANGRVEIEIVFEEKILTTQFDRDGNAARAAHPLQKPQRVGHPESASNWESPLSDFGFSRVGDLERQAVFA